MFEKTIDNATKGAVQAGQQAVEGVLDHVEDQTIPAAEKAAVEIGKALLDKLDQIIRKKRIKILIEVYDEAGPDQ
jgi:hypothetical protein